MTAAACLTIAAAGCGKLQTLALHYTPDPAIPSAVHFFPAKVAVASAHWNGGINGKIGGVFDTQGFKLSTLVVRNAGGQIAQVIAQALQAAGLQATAIGAPAADGAPPVGVDFLVTAEVDELTCQKHFIPGPNTGAFQLHAHARLNIAIVGPGGRRFTGEGVGMVDEPPAGADLATYKPPITEPADAVSIALSRAIQSVIGQKGFASALPQRTAAGQ